MESFTHRFLCEPRLWLLLISCGWCSTLSAQFTGSAKVDELLSTASYDAGQCELILIRDGQVAYQQIFGDIENTGEKKVRIAAASKWLVAAILLKLVDEQLISLDDGIGKYLPRFKNEKAEITLRQLLSHTSGLPASTAYLKNKNLSLAQSVDSIADKVVLAAEPGTQFIYGNTSFQVAARLAEVVSGKDWETLFNEKIVQPCKMKNTDFGKQRNKNAGEGAYSTASDYSNFLLMILNKGEFEGTRVLSQKAIREMMTDQTAQLPSANTPYQTKIAKQSGFYGLGVWIDRIMQNDSSATEISSQGEKGFTPWVNYCKNLIGVYAFYADIENVSAAISASKKIIDTAFKGNCNDIASERGAKDATATPSVSQTKISFRLDYEAMVTLKLFDPLGNEILVLLNGMTNAGDYAIPIDVSKLAPGVYFYRLIINDRTETKKITIKK